MLDSANRSGRLSHAYLITGPDQVGRRTLAIDLACLLNCDPQPDLFGEAPTLDLASSPVAQRIRKGQHADVRIISSSTSLKRDSATNFDESDGPVRQRISIEHIHDLQHDAALKPFEGKFRVFIIDGAEGLSQEAANSLLKTLEEPYDNVCIVLVASATDALPETIVSRCQRINLKPVNAEVISAALVSRFKADPALSDRLARLTRGKPGWAISALQDPAVLELNTQTAWRIASTISADLEQRFVYARDLSGRFRRDRDGVLNEMRRWLEWWRDVAVVKAGLTGNAINVDWVPALTEIAAPLKESDIAAAASAVSRTTQALEANAIPRLALEVLMLDLPTVTLSESAMSATASA
jgi:DNA polymerase-3 subunit delta'